MPTFSGRVHSVVFQNASQGFYILRMVLDGTENDENGVPKMEAPTVTVRGNIPGLQIKIGTWFGWEGDWTRHPTFGPQILITKAPVIDKWNPETASSVLVANGIGERLMGLVRGHFGDHLVTVLDQHNPELLHDVIGMTPLSAEHLIFKWKLVKGYFKTLGFLADAGIPRHRVRQVWSMFGDDVADVLTSNPWRLVQIDGISFSQADDVATRMGLDKDNPYRVEGAILYSVKAAKTEGHMFVTPGEVLSRVQGLIPYVGPSDIAFGIKALHKDKRLLIDRSFNGINALYDPWLYQIEMEGSEGLLERKQKAALHGHDSEMYLRGLMEAALIPPGGAISPLQETAEKAVEVWSKSSRITLTSDQRQAVLNALTEPISIITGLPGTGKSTLTRAVVDILKDAGVKFLMLAPTGIAAKRIASITGYPAATIHRAFGAKGGQEEEEGRDATYVGVTGISEGAQGSDGQGGLWDCMENPYPAGLVLVDEMSMVDAHLLWRILKCTRPDTRLVLVGDAAQLPSVGPGNVLRDLISSGLFPTVSLVDIFRQADTSGIVLAAHAVHRGEPPVAGLTGDFILKEMPTEEKVLDIIITAVKRIIDTHKERGSLGDFDLQVISPRHAGTVGVTSLNAKLREILNPQRPGLQEVRIGSEVIREEDRIMVIKNNYKLDIFNGDIGTVTSIDRKKREVEISVRGPTTQLVKIPFADVSDYLRLAYCVTVHKSQGQEYDCVVMPIVMGFGYQLQRNLFYTAITRAKKKVVLVGQQAAVSRSVYNDRQDRRNTLFLERLRNGTLTPIPRSGGMHSSEDSNHEHRTGRSEEGQAEGSHQADQ